jgi:rhodanese-related sulfurtransferase
MFKPRPNNSLFPGQRWRQAGWQSVAVFAIAVLIGLTANSLRHARLPLVADWSMRAQMSSVQGENGLSITFDEAEALYFDQGAVFLDARPKELFDMGHIEGARSLPWENFGRYFPETMSDVPKDSIIITYCDGESCGLSKELASALTARGYDQVRVLVDGWRLWQQFNLPVEP